jgi:hypothetical protein
MNEVVLPASLLRDLCFSNDLTYFFVAEWRAEDVHANVGGDSPQLGHISGKKAPPRGSPIIRGADAGFVFSNGERDKCYCGRSFGRAH